MPTYGTFVLTVFGWYHAGMDFQGHVTCVQATIDATLPCHKALSPSIPYGASGGYVTLQGPFFMVTLGCRFTRKACWPWGLANMLLLVSGGGLTAE